MKNQGGMKVLSSDGTTPVAKLCKHGKYSLRFFIPKSVVEACGLDSDMFVTVHPDSKNDGSFVVRKVKLQPR